MRDADCNGSLDRFFNPALDSEERAVAAIEGWSLGVA